MDIVTGVGVLDKAVHVLRAVAVAPTSLSELQRATGLPRATAHRLAVALEEHGLLRRGGDGRFELGLEPVLTRLRDETGESVQLFVREGNHRRCVLSLQSPHALRWIVPDGALFPLEHGSAGRVLSGQLGSSGWVASVEEREAGVASVSAPVIGHGGHVVAAVSISGPIDRLTRQPGKRYGAAVVAAAAEIS
jgi:DNA-binding IclR family transcriptional regulator